METILIFLAILAAILIFLWVVPLGFYYQCKVYQVNLSLLSLVLMRWRKVPPGLIVNSLIKAKREGIVLDPGHLEAYYFVGGNVYDLTEAVIYANQKGADIELKHLMNVNLITKDLKALIDSYLENKANHGNDYSFEKLI
jgi:uncharacterized protein YqfA (UPF0365 family)